MKSTCSSQNADNMSRKSGFSNRLSLEGPSIQSELPHHLQPLRWRRQSNVFVVVLILKLGDPYFSSVDWHHTNVIIPSEATHARARICGLQYAGKVSPTQL